MCRWLLISITLVGCTTDIAPTPTLRVEPEAMDLDVDLAAAPPTGAIHVYASDEDGLEYEVTAGTTFTFTGAQLGTVDNAQLTSDGVTGGASILVVQYQKLSASVPVTARVHCRRVVEGTLAPDAFATATPTPVDAQLSPVDRVVLPPNLGELDLDFIADDLDDTHQVHITAPYLDLTVVAPGVAGPRELVLAANEWKAIARTVRGGDVHVEVASLASTAPATVKVASATYSIADVDVRDVMFGAMMEDTTFPILIRYDMKSARLQPALAGPDGTCVGCHVAVSADGKRLAAGVASTAGGPAGILFDLEQGTIITTSDAMPTPWVAGAFDPSGVLVTSSKTGDLDVRDATTGEVTRTITTGELATSPAISPDGHSLAYTELDVAGATIANPLGDALHVRPWNAATGEVGAPVELVRDARKVVMPMYSADGKWIAYGHTPDLATEMPFLGSGAVKTDGSGTIVELTTDPLDRLARFASAPQPGKMWVVFTSSRPFGSNPAGIKQLWLETFDPDTGALSPAFHLPGQHALDILHGPTPLP